MKRAFFYILLTLLSTVVFSQSLQILDTKDAYTVKIGDQVKTTIKIKNISNEPIHVLVRRDQRQIGSSQKTFFCWDGDCTDPDASQIFVSQIIKPGEILETFASVLETGLDETVASIKYTFYNRDEPSDFVDFQLSYTVKDQVNQGLMYNSNLISLSDIYPNPVSDLAYLDYIIYDKQAEAKIVFHNILGSVVGQYELNPLEREMKVNTMEYKPGVYFYTLYVENEGKVTKKLVIKR